MSPEDKMLYRIAFSMIRGCNLGLASKMLSILESEETFFYLSDNDLRNTLNVKGSITSSSYRSELIEKAKREMDFIMRSGIKTLYFTDEVFPKRLLSCEDGPVMLYALGNANLNASKILSVVGTRRATAYGVEMTRCIVKDLADEYGDSILIVSGLAYGIDVASHRAALEAGIPTVAITAHPLNTIYPAQHRSVAVEMLKHNGGLVTEYPTCSVVHRSNFLQRNRIIAGIADATLVSESDEKGGSLVTASIAMAYNRDVFAIPGRITDTFSRGTNRLIAHNRAALVRDAGDIIDAMRWERKPREGDQATLNLELSPEQISCLECIRDNPDFTVNEISRTLGISYSALTNVLFELEMSDLIVTIPGNRYILTALASNI